MRLLGTLFLQMSSIIQPFIGLQRKRRDSSHDQYNHHGGTKMNSLKIALVALMLTGFFSTQAKAQNHTVDAIIIGTAVAGIVGLIVASEMDINRYGRERVYHQPVVYSPPPPRYYRNRDNSRHDFRPAENHRNIVTSRNQRWHSRQPVEVNYRDRR